MVGKIVYSRFSDTFVDYLGFLFELLFVLHFIVVFLGEIVIFLKTIIVKVDIFWNVTF